MRAVIQRASTATVRVDDEVVGRLPGPGLCVFLGVTHEDTEDTARRMAVKIHELRILRDERSAADVDARSS